MGDWAGIHLGQIPDRKKSLCSGYCSGYRSRLTCMGYIFKAVTYIFCR
jgi:hypothetical protein